MIDLVALESKFVAIGARLKVADPLRRDDGKIRLDIQSDRQGEYFEIRRPVSTGRELIATPQLEVLNVQKRDRHLLLMIRELGEKSKFLCGHDERHWFVAAIPETASVGTVQAAKDALKPAEVIARQALVGIGFTQGNSRKNAAFRRQGEWFFLPDPAFRPNPKFLIRNEPLVRGGGGGKPHWVDECFRTGGEDVRVCPRYPNGVLQAEYERIIRQEREANTWNWRFMKRDPHVHVRGRIRHADHATITLPIWHRVLMNTENQSKAMRHVAFLD